MASIKNIENFENFNNEIFSLLMRIIYYFQKYNETGRKANKTTFPRTDSPFQRYKSTIREVSRWKQCNRIQKIVMKLSKKEISCS